MLLTVAFVAARRSRRRVAPSAAAETARVRALYDREAARYDRTVRVPERLLFGDGRAWAASHAVGDVLEIAVGTGRNFPCYSRDVRMTAFDLSAAMLEFARARARTLELDVDLHVADAQDLPFPAERFDSVVCTLSLCTIPDDRRALAEARRVLRSGGRLVLLEHVRSPHYGVRLLQQLVEPLAVRFAGDHLLRDPLDFSPTSDSPSIFRSAAARGLWNGLSREKRTDDV